MLRVRGKPTAERRTKLGDCDAGQKVETEVPERQNPSVPEAAPADSLREMSADPSSELSAIMRESFVR